MHRPDVLQRLRAAAAARRRAARLHPAPARVADRLHRAAGQDHRRVQRRDAPLRPRPAGAVGGLRQGPAQGRRDARTPGPVHRRGGGAVHRPGAGEDPPVPHRAPPRRPRDVLPVDRAGHRDGQPVLRLRRRRRLRPVLPEVLLLLPLQRQAVPQRPRVGQTPSRQGRDRVHRAGQRVRHLRRPRRGAGDLRPARPGADRRAAAQVAGDPAAPVHRGRPGRRLPLRHRRSCRPSSP